MRMRKRFAREVILALVTACIGEIAAIPTFGQASLDSALLASAPAPVPAQESAQREHNYSPILTPLEKLQLREGPFPEPERDCVRTPQKSLCGCKEMIQACADAIDECDADIQRAQKEAKSVEKDSYFSKIDRPLLNTLQISNASDATHLPSCRICFDQIAKDPAWTPRNDAFLRPKSRNPGEVKSHGAGTQSKDDRERLKALSLFGKDILKKSQSCSPDETTGLEACLTYFWSCDENRKRLEDWSRRTMKETE